MTSKLESGMTGLLPFCENNEALFRAPGDMGSVESGIPLWNSFGCSYKLEGRAFSQPYLPARTVTEWDAKKKAWVNKKKDPKPLFVRTLNQHLTGIDSKKLAEGKEFKPGDMGSMAQIQLARDFSEPWKTETKNSLLRGVFTPIPFHATYMNVVFMDGHCETFGSKTAWDLARGKRPGDGDD